MTVKFRPPHKDTGAILKDAARRLDVPTRRAFLRNVIGLGSLTLLSGCDVVDGVSAERMLQNMSDFNDRVQALLFDPNKQLYHKHRHANRAASPDATRFLVRWRGASAQIWFPDETQNSNKTRLQKSQAHWRDRDR
jgi:hypothetical protein